MCHSCNLLSWHGVSVSKQAMRDLTCLNPPEYAKVLEAAAAAAASGAISALTMLKCAGVYACLVMAAIFIINTELRLPLVHYRSAGPRSVAPVLASASKAMLACPTCLLQMA